MWQAQKTTRIWIKPRIYHKKCKPKSNIRLETQRHKARTQYMLEDD
jgi:hypothetical protein